MAAAEPSTRSERFRAMGSDVVVFFDGPDSLLGYAAERLGDLEGAWSRFIPTSDVSRLNMSGEWETVGTATIDLFHKAAAAWEMTRGAFDPTVLGSLVASGYGTSRSEIPGQTVLDSIPSRAPAPGMAQITIDAEHDRIRVPWGMGFDPGGIGKGLAADSVAEGLVASGASAAMVGVGGDVRVAGSAPRRWMVEVESPYDPDVTIATLSLRDGAVCTSSVRAKAWTNRDVPTHHIIDPTTGRPTSSSIVSATVIAGEAWIAEALCKAAVCTEPLDAIAFCSAYGVEAIIVDLEGVVWTTDTIARFAA